MKYSKVFIAVGLEEETDNALAQINNFIISAEAKIHLIHIVPTILYARGMHPAVLTYPLPEERPRIEKAILERLRSVGEKIFPGRDLQLSCLFGKHQAETFCDLLKGETSAVAIVATRGKHGISGLFDSSFAQYLCKFSLVPVIVLR